MLKQWKWFFRRSLQNLSVKASLYAIGAVAAALMAVKLAPYISDDLGELLGGDAANSLLTILASSMLVVVTFSMSTLLASYSIATGVAPSRGTSFVVKNEGAQAALSTFLGAFIFSIVAIVALSTKYYGPKGRSILFIMTIVVLAFVIYKIIRWIGQLSELGHLNQVLKQIEAATIRAIRSQPHSFDWNRHVKKRNDDKLEPLHSEKTGFIQSIDLELLQEIAEETKQRIRVETRVGEFISEDGALAYLGSDFPKEKRERVVKCFFMGKERTFEEDPRFGLIVLSEISSRALSPGINDPGTSIETIGTLVRILQEARKTGPDSETRHAEFSSLDIKRITPDELFDDAFRATSRDGAGMLEVVVFLQKALRQLSQYPQYELAALKMSAESVTRAEETLKNAGDLARIKAAAARLTMSVG